MGQKVITGDFLDISDHMIINRGSVACAISIFIGAVVSAAGSNQDSFGLVVGGRVVMGFGSTVIETCTSKVSRRMSMPHH